MKTFSMKRFRKIKTAAELVEFVRTNGMLLDEEAYKLAQKIFDSTDEAELVRLANDDSRSHPDDFSNQDIFYHIAFNIMTWRYALDFWNQHTNPEHMAFDEVKAENARLRAAKVDLEDKVETLQHEQDMQTREMEKLRSDERSMIAALEDAEAEVVNLKAELYDYMKAVD